MSANVMLGVMPGHAGHFGIFSPNRGIIEFHEFEFSLHEKMKIKSCGLYYKSFMIVIYDRNDSTIIIYYLNDSGQYYKTINYDPSQD